VRNPPEQSSQPEPASTRPQSPTVVADTRRAGGLARYIGSRLVLGGRLLALLGLVLLVVVATKAYLAYTRHDLGTTITTGVAGGILGLAIMSVGESLTRSGASYLRGEKHLGRLVGRAVGRRRARRSGSRTPR